MSMWRVCETLVGFGLKVLKHISPWLKRSGWFSDRWGLCSCHRFVPCLVSFRLQWFKIAQSGCKILTTTTHKTTEIRGDKEASYTKDVSLHRERKHKTFYTLWHIPAAVWLQDQINVSLLFVSSTRTHHLNKCICFFFVCASQQWQKGVQDGNDSGLQRVYNFRNRNSKNL